MLERFKVGQKKKLGACCCVALLADGVAVAVAVEKSAGHYALKSAAFLPATDERSAQSALATYVHQQGLRNAHCAFVLQPHQYRLMYMDVPLVLENELQKAAKWLVKDLIQYPIEDAVVDVIPVPSRPGQKKMYVVATKVEELEMVTGFIRRAGLNPFSINILEMPYKKLASLLPEAEQGVAILYASANTVHLMIAKAGDLRIVRDIGDLMRLYQASGYEQLALEVQRSLDFYQGQLSERAPVKLYVVNDHRADVNLIPQLANNLGLSVVSLPVDKMVPEISFMTSLDADRCLSVMGQALLLQEVAQ